MTNKLKQRSRSRPRRRFKRSCTRSPNKFIISPITWPKSVVIIRANLVMIWLTLILLHHRGRLDRAHINWRRNRMPNRTSSPLLPKKISFPIKRSLQRSSSSRQEEKWTSWLISYNRKAPNSINNFLIRSLSFTIPIR